MTKVEPIELVDARATFYSFFSRTFIRVPDEQFLATLISDETLEHLGEIFSDPDYQQELAGLRRDARQGRLNQEGVALDFEALFRVPGPYYLSPYESVYRSQSAGSRGCLCGPETLAVEQVYLQEEMGPEEGFNELPDHVGVELEFMAVLCRKAAAAMRAKDGAAAEEYQGKQEDFFTKHLGPWARLLASRLAVQAQTSLYRFLGKFLNLFLELEGNLRFRPGGEWPPLEAADPSLEQGVRQ